MDLSQDGYLGFLDIDVDNTIQTLKSTYGKLYFLEVQNVNTADAWFQLFDYNTVDRGDISAVATHTDGAKFTSTAHGLIVGDVIIHEGCTDSAYNGEFTVLTLVDANNYTTSATYTADDTTGTFILKPKLSVLVPSGDGTVHGSKVIPIGPQGLNFDISIKYSAATTVGAKTDPTTGLILNALYQ